MLMRMVAARACLGGQRQHGERPQLRGSGAGEAEGGWRRGSGGRTRTSEWLLVDSFVRPDWAGKKRRKSASGLARSVIAAGSHLKAKPGGPRACSERRPLAPLARLH